MKTTAHDVRLAARAAARAVDRVGLAELRRDDAIRQALRDGVPVRELVLATGMHRTRIYQIRDGRR